MFVCAGRNEIFSFASVIGIGLVESAYNLTRICLEKKPSEIIFIGSAGAYGEDSQIFDLHFSRTATQIESSSLFDKSYTPLQNRVESKLEFRESQKGKSSFGKVLETECKKEFVSCGTIINSSNYITTDSVVAQEFFTRGILLENMEFFSVMQVAEYFKIPCCGILCVSNYCAPNAHKEFMTNHSALKIKIENFYTKFLDLRQDL